MCGELEGEGVVEAGALTGDEQRAFDDGVGVAELDLRRRDDALASELVADALEQNALQTPRAVRQMHQIAVLVALELELVPRIDRAEAPSERPAGHHQVQVRIAEAVALENARRRVAWLDRGLQDVPWRRRRCRQRLRQCDGGRFDVGDDGGAGLLIRRTAGHPNENQGHRQDGCDDSVRVLRQRHVQPEGVDCSHSPWLAPRARRRKHSDVRLCPTAGGWQHCTGIQSGAKRASHNGRCRDLQRAATPCGTGLNERLRRSK